MTNVPVMFHWRAVSSNKLNSVAGYVREGLNLRVECACSRVVILQATKVRADCFNRSIPMVISQLEIRMRCLQCKKRGHVRIGPIG